MMMAMMMMSVKSMMMMMMHDGGDEVMMLLVGHTKFSAFKKYSNNDIVSEKNIFFPLLGGEVGGPDPKVENFP